MKRLILVAISVLCVSVAIAETAQDWFDIPEALPFYQYGDLLMNRNSSRNDMPPVYFSHWRHRVHNTCRVCHLELEFEMRRGASEITEEMNRAGFFCGACHDGKTAFGHTEENCDRCHAGKLKEDKKAFMKAFRRFPRDRYGNRIDWTAALRRGLIRPVQSVFEDEYSPLPFNRTLSLYSNWTNVPPAVFPHEAHTDWLDCSNCHPHIFNIKKKTTKHFSMVRILKKEFCGVCHYSVAFPLDDCKRCHPAIKED